MHDHTRRRFAHMPLLPAATALAVGIGLARWPAIDPQFSPVVLLIAALVCGRLIWRKRLSPIHISLLLLCLFTLTGYLRYTVQDALETPQQLADALPLSGLSLSGRIEAITDREGRRCRVAVDSWKKSAIRGGDAGDILVRLPFRGPRLTAAGGRICLQHATLEPLPKPRNPGQFDYGNYLRNQGIWAVCNVRDSLNVAIDNSDRPVSLQTALIYPARQHLLSLLPRHFQQPVSGFLAALLLGDRRDLDPHVRSAFQNAGVVHVLAISGLHVGFVAGFCYLLLSFFPVPFKVRNICTILLLAAFALLTGASPPVVRAALMAGLFLLGGCLERRAPLYNHLGGAVLLMLLWDPRQLFQIGFQLSVTAVAAILYFTDRLAAAGDRLLEETVRRSRRKRLKNLLILPLAVSLAAQLGTLPLVVACFQRIPIIGLLVNIVVIPLTGAIVALGLLFFLLAGPGVLPGAWLAGVISPLVEIMIRGVQYISRLPGAYIETGAADNWVILIYVTAVLLPFQLHVPARRTILGGVLIAAVMVKITLLGTRPPVLDVIFLDVGQGDGILIRTPAGKTFLVDAGPRTPYTDAARRAVLPTLKELGIPRIEGIFVSHPHLDHAGGVFTCIEELPVDTVYFPETRFPNVLQDSLSAALATAGIPERGLRAGGRLVLDPHTRLYVLGPLSPFPERRDDSGSGINNNSLVLLLRFRERSLLLTGDAEFAAEQALQQWGSLLQTEVQKIGHHGSNTSTGGPFLQHTDPQYAVISAGKYNRFNHPAPAVLERLRQKGIQVWRTDADNAVWLQADETGWRQIHWK